MTDLTKDQKTIIKYLKEQVVNGKRYFKSKHIGEELGMSAHTIGTNLEKLSKNYKSLLIYPWSTTDSITWAVDKPIKVTNKKHMAV